MIYTTNRIHIPVLKQKFPLSKRKHFDRDSGDRIVDTRQPAVLIETSSKLPH